MANKLTPKQAVFVEEYLIDLNATQAAIRAGYKSKTAKSIGQENLTKPVIADAIAKAQAARSQRTQINADRVLLELGRLAFSDFRKLFDADGRFKGIHDIDDDTAAAVSSVEIVEQFDKDGAISYLKKIRLWPKVPANEMLGKYLQMFIQRMEITGKDGEALNVNIYLPDNQRNERRD